MYASLGQTFLFPLSTSALVLYVCVFRKNWVHCLPLHSLSMYVFLDEKSLGPLSTFAFFLYVCVFGSNIFKAIVYLCIRSLCMCL